MRVIQSGSALMPVLVGALIGLLGLVVLLSRLEHTAEQAGLGIATIPGIVEHPRGRFEFNSGNALSLTELMAKRNLPRKVLWLGASQLYGINGWQAGDRTVGYRLFHALSANGVDLGLIGLPNATPREHLVLVARLIPEIDPELLILAAVYDDMRHPDIRPWVKEVARAPKTAAVLSPYEAGREILAQTGVGESDGPVRQISSEGESRGPVRQINRGDKSWMKMSEEWLTGTLEKAFGMETARKEGRAAILLTLREIRRFFETLRSRWTRDLSNYQVPVPPTPYMANLAAWRAMLEITNAREIAVLIYIAPRPADFFPYNPGGYAAYKRDLRQLADRYGAHLISLEDAVPPRHWGYIDIAFGFPYRDPFHFKDSGHRLMSEALLPEIRRQLEIIE